MSEKAKSFFDNMEDFEANEKIGMVVLNNIPARASEYSAEDLECVKKLLEDRGKEKNNN